MNKQRSQQRRRSQGFTLIELMVVFGIIMMIAAVTIPNLLGAMDRAKQKGTMADIRQLSQALERFAIDNNTYPEVAGIEDLVGLLEPDYVRETPVADRWGNPLVYECVEGGRDFTLTSLGKDGEKQSAIFRTEIASVDDDIVFEEGKFLQKPEANEG